MSSVGLAKETVRLATAGSETVTIVVPMTDSLVATTLAPPGAIAVTNPAGETVRILGLLVDQLTARPASTPPAASRVVAVAVVVSPIRRVDFSIPTLTLATGAGPAAPPPPPQLTAATHNAMAVRERSWIKAEPESGKPILLRNRGFEREISLGLATMDERETSLGQATMTEGYRGLRGKTGLCRKALGLRFAGRDFWELPLGLATSRALIS
jgi:hypothetical protein